MAFNQTDDIVRCAGTWDEKVLKAHELQPVDQNSNSMDQKRNCDQRQELQYETNRKPSLDFSQNVGKLNRYNALWIENKDGISYRWACGRIPKHVWEVSALNRVDIHLG
jgi:hypothetical protein